MSRHSAGPPSNGEQGQQPRPRRKRVVLADSRAPVTVLRTVVELEEQTSYGEELVSNLVGRQLRTSLTIAFITGGILGVLPVLFFTVPSLAEMTIAGVRLPWLALGVLPFPLLFGMGYVYNTYAERHERDFVDMVEK
ncbi:hypothetical protein EV193_10510 [Herbihabitans rhizosphaerae]|uniref:Uncharacterized protein n=1 Tax=Herbihabitans rhizosphaerae TaxID=1872711 RepID=A0A4Q7KMC6_9PSEU|nr:hypothetical protein [Herbihabitans rhizosphaerae]RZS37456.1 hypothetical protein EV193_10510 [Herbihabitans rhizosphaerae]